MYIDPVNLLLVQDDDSHAALILQELHKEDCHINHYSIVHTETQYETALLNDDWDIIISDLTTKNLSPQNVLYFVRQLKLDIPVIFTSNNSDQELVIELLKAGARDFISFAELNRLPYAMVREIRDNKERRRVEDELYHTQVRFRSLLENIPGIVYRCEINVPWRMIHINQYIERITGYNSERFIKDPQLTWAEIAYKEDIDELVRIVDRAVETRTQFEAEYRICHISGEIRWVHEIGQCVLDADNEPVWLDGVIMDITDRENAENAIHESEKRYRTLFESANDGMMIHDMSMRFLDANSLACERLGYSREELLQKEVVDIVSPVFAGRTRQQFELTKTLGRTVYETEHVRRDGSYIPVEISCTKIVYNGEDAILGIVRDITERKATENALRESEMRYRAVYNHMNEGLVSHEIVYDDDGNPVDYRITDVNPMYESIVHILREDAIGKLASELYDVDKPPFLDLYAKVAETGEPIAFDTYFKPMDRHFRVSAFSPGKGRFVTLFADITNTKVLL